MQSKSLLIAIAAFTLTTTGASAYSGKIISRANLTDDQRTALEEAHTLSLNGHREKARDLLVESGVDEEVLRSLKRAATENRDAIHDAIESGNFELFRHLTTDLPISDVVTTEADFELLQEAHELRKSGAFEEAGSMFAELGLSSGHHRHLGRNARIINQLSDEQREALRVARQANDRATVRAILEEVGVEK